LGLPNTSPFCVSWVALSLFGAIFAIPKSTIFMKSSVASSNYDVARLQVAVNHTTSMSVVEGVANLQRHIQQSALFDEMFAFQHLREITAFCILHQNIWRLVVGCVVVDMGYIWMIQVAGGSSLGFKSLKRQAVAEQLWNHNLDGQI
jgi:hypothetical protein